jgi:hypothetical protein
MKPPGAKLLAVTSCMVVLLNGISMKKFKDSDDGTLVIDELDILGYEL